MLVSRNTLIAISTALLAVVLTVSCYSPRETEADEAIGRVATEGTESTEEDDLFASQEPEATRVVLDPGKNAPFPSLEDQRAADLAYKMFELEIEPLNEDELAKVKAFGYDGGVRASHEGRSDDVGLLVGLHAWPIQSLKDVGKILRRDDIAELSPLKFIVIRPSKSGREDERVTIRLPVKLVTNRLSESYKILAEKRMYEQEIIAIEELLLQIKLRPERRSADDEAEERLKTQRRIAIENMVELLQSEEKRQEKRAKDGQGGGRTF